MGDVVITAIKSKKTAGTYRYKKLCHLYSQVYRDWPGDKGKFVTTNIINPLLQEGCTFYEVNKTGLYRQIPSTTLPAKVQQKIRDILKKSTDPNFTGFVCLDVNDHGILADGQRQMFIEAMEINDEEV